LAAASKPWFRAGWVTPRSQSAATPGNGSEGRSASAHGLRCEPKGRPESPKPVQEWHVTGSAR
jgi:hypothetical protein